MSAKHYEQLVMTAEEEEGEKEGEREREGMRKRSGEEEVN